MKKVVETDILKTRQFYTRDYKTNQNIPAGSVLNADGQGGSYWGQQTGLAVNAFDKVAVGETVLRASEFGAGTALALEAGAPLQLKADTQANKITIGFDGSDYVSRAQVERLIGGLVAQAQASQTQQPLDQIYRYVEDVSIRERAATTDAIKSSIVPYMKTAVANQTYLTHDKLESTVACTVASIRDWTADRLTEAIDAISTIQCANGSAAEPAVSFMYDKGVGMYRPGPQLLAFSTKGEERLRINSAGCVGIGVKDPIGALDVSGSVHVRGPGSALVMPNGVKIRGLGTTASELTIDDGCGDIHLRTGLGSGNSVRIGAGTDHSTGTGTGTDTIAIGTEAGATNQGSYAIAIGKYAGSVDQPARSVIINGSGFVINGAHEGALYISPMRSTETGLQRIMAYDPRAREVINVPTFYSRDGRIGIGSEAPAHALDVSGSIGLSGGLYVDGVDVVAELRSTVKGLEQQLAPFLKKVLGA